MKCTHCGKFLFKKNATLLSDGQLCDKCVEALGFDVDEDRYLFRHLIYDNIKVGKEAYIQNYIENQKRAIVEDAKKRIGVKIAHYGEERDIEATAEELEIFGILQEMTAPKEIRLVRVSDNYVSAKLGDWDLARFKYTDRTAWIFFPTLEKQKDKHQISDPEDVRSFSEIVRKSLEHIEKYS